MVPPTLVGKVLFLMHDDIFCGGHVGITALNTKLVKRFYWRNLYASVAKYVQSCQRCSLRKRAPHFKSRAKSWDRPLYPWQVVQTDYVGPLRRSERGKYVYILTFIDLLTGWPEAFPTQDCSAVTTATVFLQQIVCRYGKIERLHSDRGANYVAKLFKEITRRTMCKQSFTSARMPQGNARCERLHKTLHDSIGVYIDENHEQWPEMLPIALWHVRSTISARTGFSPYTLLYGRDNPSLGYPEGNDFEVTGTDREWFLRTKHCIEVFDEVAKGNTKKYEKAMRARLDKTARPVQFTEGEFVFYYDPTCAENSLSKFANRYRGPYRIEEAVDDNRVRIRSLRTGRVIDHLVNINKLKRAYPREECEVPNQENEELSEEEAEKEEENLEEEQNEEHAGATGGEKKQSARFPKQNENKRGWDPSGEGQASRDPPPNLPTPVVHNRTPSQKGVKPQSTEAVPVGERPSTQTASLNEPGAPKTHTRAPSRKVTAGRTRAPIREETAVRIRNPLREITVKKKPKRKGMCINKKIRKVSFQEEGNDPKKEARPGPTVANPVSDEDGFEASSEDSDEDAEVRDELSERGEESSDDLLSEEEGKSDRTAGNEGKFKTNPEASHEDQEMYEQRFRKNERQKKTMNNWTDLKSVLPPVEEETRSARDVQRKQVQAQAIAHKTLKAREQSERLLAQQKLRKERDGRAEARRKARDLQWQRNTGVNLEEEEVELTPDTQGTDKLEGKVKEEVELKAKETEGRERLGTIPEEGQDVASSDSSI